MPTPKFEFNKGEEYKLFCELRNIAGCLMDAPVFARYVRREHLPKTGGDWETFFSVFKDGSLDSRIRIPVKGIAYVMNDNVFSKHSGFYSAMVYDGEYSPIVQSWLVEVADIQKSLQAKNSCDALQVLDRV